MSDKIYFEEACKRRPSSATFNIVKNKLNIIIDYGLIFYYPPDIGNFTDEYIYLVTPEGLPYLVLEDWQEILEFISVHSCQFFELESPKI